MRHGGGDVLNWQAYCEYLRAPPLNSVECGMAYSPTRLASCPSRWLSLVCKIPVLLLSLSETNTIGYYQLAQCSRVRPMLLTMLRALCRPPWRAASPLPSHESPPRASPRACVVL